MRRAAALVLLGTLLAVASFIPAWADIVYGRATVYSASDWCLEVEALIREGDSSPAPLFYGDRESHTSSSCSALGHGDVWKAMYLRLYFYDPARLEWLPCRDWGWFYSKETLQVKAWEFGIYDAPYPCGQAYYGTMTWAYASFFNGWRGGRVWSGYHWFAPPLPPPWTTSPRVALPPPPTGIPLDNLVPPLPAEQFTYPPDPPAPV